MLGRRPDLLKLCLLGDGGVGKTTLVHRIITGEFSPTTKMTIGIEHHVLKMTIPDPAADLKGEEPKKVDLEVQVWDFGGEGQFRFLQPEFVKGATGGLLLYDLTRIITTKRLNEWKSMWEEHIDILEDGTKPPLYLIGSKCDLLNKGRLNIEEINLAKLAESLGIEKKFIISSKSGYSIDLLVDNIVKDMYIFNLKRLGLL